MFALPLWLAPYVKYAGMALALAAAMACFFAGYHVRSLRAERDQATAMAEALQAQADDFKKRQAVKDAIAASTEAQLAKADEANRRLNRRMFDVISASPSYHDCKPTDDGLRALNETVAARGGIPSGEHGEAVRAAGPHR